MAIYDLTEISSSIAQGTLPWQPIFIVAERRRLVALPGGLMLGSALHLVFHFLHRTSSISATQTSLHRHSTVTLLRLVFYCLSAAVS